MKLTVGQQVTMWIGFVWGLFGLSMFVLLGIHFYQNYHKKPSILDKWNPLTKTILIGFLISMIATFISGAFTG